MKAIEGKKEEIGRITNVLVQWNGSKGTMEFWKSYPSFSAKGVKPFEADHELSREEVQEAIDEWSQGGGLSFERRNG